MRRVKIAELKDQLSKHLRAVERGAEIEVTDRDRPIARIIPIPGAGSLDVIPAERPFRTIRGKRYRPVGWRVRSLDVLLEDRRKR